MLNKWTNTIHVITILLLLCITISGVLSFSTDQMYDVVNQYGDVVTMWGSGIYAHDSYFKAPIFIGMDIVMLLMVVPFCIQAMRNFKREKSTKHYITIFCIYSLILYYCASIVFGVTYNVLHLVYITLFAISFFYTGWLFLKLYTISISERQASTFTITKGIIIFLYVGGISLFVAWLPDIIQAFVKGTSLELIEVYTTEITYVLDMGIISPLIFITLYLIKKGKFIGYVLLRMVLFACIGIGIMLPMQSLCQIYSGISLTLPVLITKVGIFVIMACFAIYFYHYLTKTISYSES